MRNHIFEIGKYYHIYNRGSDKRYIILDIEDLKRFMQSLIEFNVVDPIQSIFQQHLKKKLNFSSSTTKKPLVSIVAYCINKNHFHLILSPVVDNGIEKFMQRVGGYTRYFNEKYDRSGVLFQGRFKSKIIEDNNYLLNLSAYINFNNRNENGDLISEFSKSSLEEYTKDQIKGLCNKEIVLSNFKSKVNYLEFAESSWKETLKRKEEIEF
ncbi:MAG: transposase [Candidatus Pacebacteria bacterium]|nr:transposase [Candidatus Paceibacterota bacterium]